MTLNRTIFWVAIAIVAFFAFGVMRGPVANPSFSFSNGAAQ